MQFDIRPSGNYTEIIVPNSPLSNELVTELKNCCTRLTLDGHKNYLIDLNNCRDITNDFIQPLISLATDHYENGQSFVLSNIPANALAAIKAADAIDSLNYAPTRVEAIDIISMEILERDLLDDL